MKRKVIALCIIFLCLTVCCSCSRSDSKHEQNEISVSWNKSTNVILPSGELFESESFDYDGSTYVEIPLENINPSLDCWSIDLDKMTKIGEMKIWNSRNARPSIGIYNYETAYALQKETGQAPDCLYCLCHAWVRSDVLCEFPKEVKLKDFQALSERTYPLVGKIGAKYIGSINEEASLSEIIVDGSEKRLINPFSYFSKRYILRFYSPQVECLYSEIDIIEESDGSLWYVVSSEEPFNTSVMKISEKWTGLIKNVTDE